MLIQRGFSKSQRKCNNGILASTHSKVTRSSFHVSHGRGVEGLHQDHPIIEFVFGVYLLVNVHQVLWDMKEERLRLPDREMECSHRDQQINQSKFGILCHNRCMLRLKGHSAAVPYVTCLQDGNAGIDISGSNSSYLEPGQRSCISSLGLNDNLFAALPGHKMKSWQ